MSTPSSAETLRVGNVGALTSVLPELFAAFARGDAIEIGLWPLLWMTAAAALAGFLLASAIGFALRILPLRALGRTVDELGRAGRRFNAALNNMAQGLCMFDPERRLVVVNLPFTTMFSIAEEKFRAGMTLTEFLDVIVRERHLPDEKAAAFRAQQNEAVERRLRVNYVLNTLDGRIMSVMHAPMSKGGWVTTYLDVTARHRAEAQVVHLARHDALTDLPNRAQFRQRLEQAIPLARRGSSVAVFCLDLDHFKHVNDTLGHPVGDRLLQAVARRLSKNVREIDTVGRLGGDEFAIVQPGIAGPTGASELAQRLIEAIRAPYEIDDHHIVIGLSIGIAIAPGDGTDPDQLLKSADMALYRSKSDGRGTYRFFEPAMDARAQARRILELDLRAALKNDEFELHYQPIIDLRSGEIAAFEALVRWRHPHRGMVAPKEFIPFAEDTGLIVPLGEWVLRRACLEAARWPEKIRVAVNLSAAQFRNQNLVASIVASITESGLAADRLEMEITESVLLHESEATLGVLHQLRALGVRISMDDFGTGYSSLSYLRSFPFDKIKIDRSFISELSSRKDSVAIVRAVTSLGSSLGIGTVAEGVETQEQIDQLKLEGCTEVQGYFLSEPVPAAEVSRLLSRFAVVNMAVA